MAASSDETAGKQSGVNSERSSNQRPRDAATLVIVDTSLDEPRLLMGRRRASQVFMPNKVVFPGGRVDEDDRHAPSADELAECELNKIMLQMKGYVSATRARSMALAAIRETFEETGFMIAGNGDGAAPDNGPWRAFAAEGLLPSLAGLSLFARAITPPGRPRRYDTRFFCVSADAVARTIDAPDDELSDVSWYTVRETTELDLPPITRVIIEDLADRLAAGPLGPIESPIPFYHQIQGTFRRDLLSVEDNE